MLFIFCKGSFISAQESAIVPPPRTLSGTSDGSDETSPTHDLHEGKELVVINTLNCTISLIS